jgi:hypothetical protein
MNEHAQRPPQNGWWKRPCCSGVLIGNPVAFPVVWGVIGHDDSVETCCMLASDERGVSRILQMSLDGGVWKLWRDAPEFSRRMTGTLSSDGNAITVIGNCPTMESIGNRTWM